MYFERACPICNQAAHAPEVSSDRKGEELSFEAVRPFWSGFFKERVFFTYDRCAQCGLLFTPRFFTDAQLGELYAQMPPNMEVVTTDAIVATQRRYYESAAKAGVLEGSFLEIGPDVGHIVDHAAREGQFDHFWLFEPNRAVHNTLAEATGGRPHTISAYMTDLSAVPDGSVGLAVMIHVLDHLLDPVDMLAQIRRKLRSDGALVIVTHNEKSALRYAMGKRWPPFCLQHPEVYNPKSMEALVKRAGYSSAAVTRSKNYFPIDFIAKHAAFAVGVKLDRVPLPKTKIGLKLGNMMTTARP